ncbi:FemAB family XrtA/PEP-CTERM system-associated protein [Ferrovum sp.]|uniref:FemAB family XrtA/PEP-CTERM system-associated protein n=1 Tax=Ferrovum sp. TaxID=2609467 RepID=UPI00261E4BE9|nr:FemAB family XrtA/PEP-CTERM system-associated protein [Ferrovum sp.]
MTELTVRPMTTADETAWDAFVSACPQATFFHRSGWKKIIEETFGHRTHFLLAENAQGIQGVLPLAEIRHFYFGHSLSSLPFCVYGGIAALSPEATRQLDQAAQDLAGTLKVDHLEYRQRDSLHPDWPRKELYVTFRREIDPDPEQNMKNIPRKQRAMVRSGIKNGLVSEIDDTVERFYQVFADNMLRHGTPTFPRRYFALLKSTFGEDCEVLSVLKDQQVVSSVLTFYFRDEVLPYYAGDTLAARNLAANDFKYWELLRRSCEGGYRIFDYGRSKLGTGSYHFKKNWGFEPVPLHYEYRLYEATEVPDQNPLNPKYRLFIQAWRRLPMPVANWLGPQLVKYLG